MQQKIDNIMQVFETFMMAPSAIDQYKTVGRMKLLEKITPKIASNEPIDFVMLGYPMKSPNSRDKVLGKLPDLAEEISFANFKRFNEEISKHHTPGTHISIASDGFVFNDIMGVEDRTVSAYEEKSLSMIGKTPITWFNLTDFYSKNASLASLRDKVLLQHGVSDEELEQRILLDPDVNALYRGMIKFLTLDLAVQNFASNNQLQKAAKQIARQMMYRNEAYSKLVTTEFSTSIRLSMHPSQNNGSKYSFQLIPSPKAWTSPWHCALLNTKENEYATIHRRDAEAAGYDLIYKDGQPYYFQEN